MADDADRVVTIDLQVATDLSGSDVIIQPRDGTAPLRFPAEDLASAAVSDLNLDGTSSTDGTLTGDGSEASPLSVAEPYSASERNKLAGVEAGAEANTNEDWADVGNTDPIPRAKLTEASGVGLNQSEVDARVEVGVADWAESGDTSQIPANKLGNAPSGGGGGGLSTSEVDARVRAGVLDWAETGNAATVPDTKIPSSITRDSEVPTIVRSVVEDFAETGNATQIPDSKIPSTIARDSEIPDVSGFQTQGQVDVRVQAGVSDWAEAGNADQIPLNKLGNAPSGGGGGLTTEQARSLIADWAEEGNADDVPDAKIPDAITRDSEVENFAKVGNAAQVPDAKIPTAITRDNEVEPFARVGNAGQVPDSKIPSNIARDNELPDITPFLSQAGVDGRVRAIVENFAEVGNGAQIPDGKIPANIARDTEIPSTSDIATIADARVRAGVEDWAEQGNSEQLPDSKIPASIARDSEVDARVQAGVSDWAETGNTDLIPANKLTNAPAGATSFAALTDTPASLGTAGQVPVVNAARTALEFVDAATGGGSGSGGLEVLGGPTNVDLLSDSDGVPLWFDTGITLTDDHEVYIVSFGRLEALNGPSFVLDGETLRGCLPQVAGARVISSASPDPDQRQRMIISDNAYFNTVFSFGRTAANNLLIGSSDDFHDPLPFRFIGIAPGGGGSGGGASDFVGLTDTPAALGTAGQVPVVNGDGDALVFADAATGDLDELSKELFGNFDDLLASASMSFNAPNAPVNVGTNWRTITSGDLVTLTRTQYTSGESLQGRARFRIDSFSSEPFEYRIRFVNGSTRLATLHFSDDEASRGGTKDFDVPLAPTANNLLYRYEVQARASGTLRGQVFFAGVRLHYGDGAASAAVRAEVSRDTETLRDAIAADWAQADNTDQIPASKLANASEGATFVGLADTPAAFGNAGQIVAVNPAGDGLEFTDAAEDGSGLSEAQVDDRVQVGVADWAESGNSDPIPANKLGNQRFTANDESKLDGIEAGAQANVGVEFTATASNKLAGIETGATGDQTGQEIVTAINTQLSGTTWQAGGGGGGGGDGLDQDAVDARVSLGVADWAESGNDDNIPDNKLSGSIARTSQIPGTSDIDARVSSGVGNLVADWAEVGNASTIPDSKIPSGIARDSEIPGNTEIDARVQAGVEDWAEQGNTSQIPANKLANGGSTTLTGLTDTPASLGSTGQVLAVAFGGTSTEWVNAAAGGGGDGEGGRGGFTLVGSGNVTSGPNLFVDTGLSIADHDVYYIGLGEPTPNTRFSSQWFTGDVLRGLPSNTVGAHGGSGIISLQFGTEVVLLGRTSSNTLLYASQSGSLDPTPLTLYGMTVGRGGGGGGFSSSELAAATVNITQANVLTDTGITEAQWNQTDWLVVEYGSASATAVSIGGTHTFRTARLSTLGDASVGQNPRQATVPSMFVGFGVQAAGAGTGGYIFFAHAANGNLLMAVAATDQDQHQLVLRGYNESTAIGGDGLTELQVDARVQVGVEDWAEAGNTSQIPANKLNNASGGLSQSDVDARVRAGVSDWAEQGNTGTIPDSKIPSGIARDSEIPTNAAIDSRADSRVRAGVSDWAEQGNTSLIPATKLDNAPGVPSAQATAIVVLEASAYEALTTPGATTLYFVPE